MYIEKFVSKNWGYEKWVCNNDLYCGKELFVVRDLFFSIHFHKIKDETFYVVEGEMMLLHHDVPKDFNLEDEFSCQQFPSIMEQIYLRAGDVFHVPPWLAHRVRGITDVKFMEFSTHHEDSDSYRIVKGC